MTRLHERGHSALSPGQIVQLIIASPQYAKVADSIPSQGNDKNESVDA